MSSIRGQFMELPARTGQMGRGGERYECSGAIVSLPWPALQPFYSTPNGTVASLDYDLMLIETTNLASSQRREEHVDALSRQVQCLGCSTRRGCVCLLVVSARTEISRCATSKSSIRKATNSARRRAPKYANDSISRSRIDDLAAILRKCRHCSSVGMSGNLISRGSKP
jgi:hypothetical protein